MIRIVFCVYMVVIFCNRVHASKLIKAIDELDSSIQQVKNSEINEISSLTPIIETEIVGEIDVNVFEKNALSIQLPNGRSVKAIQNTAQSLALDQSTVNTKRHQRWEGSADGYEGSSIVFTIYNEVLVGRIDVDNIVYELRRHNDGSNVIKPDTYEIKLVDLDALPACEVNHDNVITSEGGKSPAAANRIRSNESFAGDTVTIDLLAVYTPAARVSQGGVSGIEAHIIAAMDNANTAFSNSNMNVRFNMAHMEEVAYIEGNPIADLNWVRVNQNVATLRDTYHADMVSLIVESNYCGIGYVQRNPGSSFARNAFQVTDVDCAIGNLTFAHEHGHNMGMEHDPANGTSSSNASYPYSFGHFVNNSYRTVMSYSRECTSGCTRRMLFSNPNISFNSSPTGIANQRHNALTGINTATIIKDFRIPLSVADDEICFPIKARNGKHTIICI